MRLTYYHLDSVNEANNNNKLMFIWLISITLADMPGRLVSTGSDLEDGAPIFKGNSFPGKRQRPGPESYSLRGEAVGQGSYNRLSVVCVWLVSFVLSLPIAVFARMDTDEFPENCVIDWPSENSKRSYMTATFVLAFPVPLLVVSVCYGRMVTKLCTAVAPTSNSSKSNKDKRRVAKMVLAVTVMFYVCWLPFGVLQLLYYHSALPAHSSILYVQISLVGLTYLNSSAHPIIYLCVRERKKKKARTTVTRLRGRRTAEVSPTSPDGEMHPVATVSYAF
ncbi:hypothetical protein Bbelb_212790 [Branchiostoma belcheri]|nr:hypothetical protein Bbelb_212790 [Branchiostoma belcheri]